MEQRLSLVTLGVADLPRAVSFYERVLGWKAEESPPGVVFFDLNGVVFALWPHVELVKDMGLTADPVPAYRGYSLAHNVRNEEEVDEIFARLQNHARRLPVSKPFRQNEQSAILPNTNTQHEHEHDSNCLQPLLDHPSGRARVDEEGVMKSAPLAVCGSGKIVKVVVSDPANDPANN